MKKIPLCGRYDQHIHCNHQQWQEYCSQAKAEGGERGREREDGGREREWRE